MTFVSYSQNFEDVILWRALHDVEQGTYLDIGAQEPEVDSVSLAFYEAGWRGIHVDAAPVYAAKLREARPDEKVIEAAVTDAPGPIAFYELGGLSSGRSDIAKSHERNGHAPREILVPTVRLDQLLTLVEGDLHWVKIDVEGMEADVLRSWGNNPKRPWILVVESTFPNSQELTEHLWIDQVLKRGYEEAFFDGLSRYFVHESHGELAQRLNRPANVFDDFQITSRHFAAAMTREETQKQTSALEARIAALSLDVLQLRDRLHSRDFDAKALEQDLSAAEAELATLKAFESEASAQIEQLKEQHNAGQQARADLSSELLQITRLVGSDPSEFVKAPDREEALPAGAAHAAVKARLGIAQQEIQGAREFAIQQFEAGQRSRDVEVKFMGDRISALQTEIAQAQTQLAETERGRDDLRLVVDEQAAALNLIKSEVAQLRTQLVEADRFVSAIYESRRGRLFAQLGLIPRRTPKLLVQAQPQTEPPEFQVREPQQTNNVTQHSGTEKSVNEIRHTSNLLALNGSAFVDALYRTFLKRSADRAGRDHYLARLQAGDPKEKILVGVANSPEARAIGTNIEGLAELKRAQARARRWSFLSPGDGGLDARLNRLEFVIGEAHNSLLDRLDRMESSLEQVQAKLESSPRGFGKEPGVYVQGVPVSIKRGVAIRPTNSAGEFIEQLRASVQSSSEALSLSNGR